MKLAKFALVGLFALAAATMTAIPASAKKCPSNATRASYSIWEGGELKYQQVKTKRHSCGRKIQCVGGSNKQNKPRRCKWK